MSDKPVSNISVSYNIALVTIYRLPYDTRLLSDIFNGIAQKNINIDMISQSLLQGHHKPVLQPSGGQTCGCT